MIQKNQNKLKNVDNNFEGNMNDMEKITKFYNKNITQ